MTIQEHTVPRARTSDPQTSWDAAASVNNLSETKIAILMLLRGTPMCDERLIAEYRKWERIDNFPYASDQGIRSRRAELVRSGLVQAAPYKELMSTNRYGQVWQVVR
jgi:hypothetical protein